MDTHIPVPQSIGHQLELMHRSTRKQCVTAGRLLNHETKGRAATDGHKTCTHLPFGGGAAMGDRLGIRVKLYPWEPQVACISLASCGQADRSALLCPAVCFLVLSCLGAFGVPRDGVRLLAEVLLGAETTSRLALVGGMVPP